MIQSTESIESAPVHFPANLDPAIDASDLKKERVRGHVVDVGGERALKAAQTFRGLQYHSTERASGVG